MHRSMSGHHRSHTFCNVGSTPDERQAWWESTPPEDHSFKNLPVILPWKNPLPKYLPSAQPIFCWTFRMVITCLHCTPNSRHSAGNKSDKTANYLLCADLISFSSVHGQAWGTTCIAVSLGTKQATVAGWNIAFAVDNYCFLLSL